MEKGQTSIRNGIEDFLCPFTRMYITQGSGMNGGTYSHNGTMANDVNNGAGDGTKAPYYAPCTCKCVWVDKNNGEAVWKSLNQVRFANGRIDYAVFVTAHDETFNATVGMEVSQGEQLGNMGKQGNATGVHCHIEISQSADTSRHKNSYGNWIFNNEYDTDDCYFVDNTEILNMETANWRYLKDVPVEETKEEPKEDQKEANRDTFKVGDKVIPIKLQNYVGVPLMQYDEVYTIMQIDDRGAVLGAERQDGLEVWAVLSLDNIKKAE